MLGFKKFLIDEEAIGVVELVLIVVDNYLSLIPM